MFINTGMTRAASALHQKLADDPASFAVVVAGPSGVGKTSICQQLLDLDEGLRRCVTTTTRPKRAEEVDGVARHFVSEETFLSMLKAGAFVEQARVHGYLYGATLDAVFDALAGGQVMLMDIDVQGVQTWKQVLQTRCVTVFVLPPALNVLGERLQNRQSETHEAFQLRMDNALVEMQQAGEYDYLIVNDELDRAVEDLRAIIRAERNKTQRVQRLLSDLGIGSHDLVPSPSERV